MSFLSGVSAARPFHVEEGKQEDEKGAPNAQLLREVAKAKDVQVKGFERIDSLTGLLNVLSKEPKLQGRNLGFIMLDFDRVLGVPKSDVAGEGLYNAFVNLNKQRGFSSSTHYEVVNKFREKIPYRSCEDHRQINEALATLEENNWTPCVLTSRGVGITEMTLKHLNDTGINIKKENVILKTPAPPGGKRPNKGQDLETWFKSKGYLKDPKVMGKVVFVDDNASYCADVQTLAEKMNHVAVRCFHYQGPEALEKPFTKAALANMAVQLLAYVERKPIPENGKVSNLDLEYTMAKLGIDELNLESLHDVVKRIALKENVGFVVEQLKK